MGVSAPRYVIACEHLPPLRRSPPSFCLPSLVLNTTTNARPLLNRQSNICLYMQGQVEDLNTTRQRADRNAENLFRVKI